jgi:malate dehydrogenase
VVHRHRRRAAQAGHEPRRPARHQPQGHEAVGEGIKQHAPNAFVICITNPLDAMVWALQKFSGLPPNKVVGMAGVLDSRPLPPLPRRGIRRLGRGRHGLRARRPRRHMVPLVRYSTVAGIPLPDLVKMGWTTQDARQDRPAHPRRRRRDRRPAEDRLGLLRAGRFGHRDGRELPQGQEARAALRRLALNGQYGVKDLYVGVPVVIGAGGVERIVEIELNADEKAMFDKSVAVSCVLKLRGRVSAARRPERRNP